MTEREILKLLKENGWYIEEVENTTWLVILINPELRYLYQDIKKISQ